MALVAACCVSGTVSTAAAADNRSKQTVMTFTRDVEVPSRVLPAGTYVFQLADSPTDRHVVQVLDTTRYPLCRARANSVNSPSPRSETAQNDMPSRVQWRTWNPRTDVTSSAPTSAPRCGDTKTLMVCLRR
jgi:hypothetical protein